MKSKVDPLTIASMLVCVASFSATAPLTAAASAPPLAMAFWRNALGFVTLGPLLLLWRRREVAKVARGERRMLRREQGRPLALGLLAATSLALHFATFMTSTRMTSVAMSTALVATSPIWQALIAAFQGVRIPRTSWIGLALAVAGVAAAAGLDLRSGGTALVGDLLALVGAMALAGYNALSEKARSDLSTPLYSTACSLVCGLELLAVCLVAGTPLLHLDRSTGLSLLGLLLLPQLLGLGSLNFALGRASATTTSVLLLLETPVAALAAWCFLGQDLALATVPGLLLVLVGVTVVVRAGGGEQPAAPAPAPAPAPPPWPQAVLPAAGSTTAPPGPHPAAPPGRVPDPRIAWAAPGPDADDSPSITLALHGVGAFDPRCLWRKED